MNNPKTYTEQELQQSLNDTVDEVFRRVRTILSETDDVPVGRAIADVAGTMRDELRARRAAREAREAGTE